MPYHVTLKLTENEAKALLELIVKCEVSSDHDNLDAVARSAGKLAASIMKTSERKRDAQRG